MGNKINAQLCTGSQAQYVFDTTHQLVDAGEEWLGKAVLVTVSFRVSLKFVPYVLCSVLQKQTNTKDKDSDKKQNKQKKQKREREREKT